jgi:hypothetical protein
MGDLPPDLDRLGHALTHATERAVTRRRQRNDRRRRICGSVLAGLLVFAAMTPSHLGRADQPNFFSFASIEPAGAAMVCDQLRGQRFKYNDACIERHPAPQAAR